MKTFADYIVMESSTLPKEIMNNIDNNIRALFKREQFDLATAKAVEVKSFNDERFQDAWMNFLLMNDEWANSHNGQKLIIRYYDDKIGRRVFYGNQFPKNFDYTTLKPFIKKMYASRWNELDDISDKQKEREQSFDFDDETTNYKRLLLKVKNSSLVFANRIAECAKKYSNNVNIERENCYVFSENENFYMTIFMNGNKKLDFKIGIERQPPTLSLRNFSALSDNYQNVIKEIDDSVAYFKNLKEEFGDLVRIGNKIIKDSSLNNFINDYNKNFNK